LRGGEWAGVGGRFSPTEVVSEEDELVSATGADCQSVECGIPVESRAQREVDSASKISSD
jgi:hypothetical protein